MNNMKKQKLTEEQRLQEDFHRHLANVEYAEQNENYKHTFWWQHMENIIPLWKQYLSENPDKIDTVLRGFAWHAYHEALKMR